MGRLEGVLCLNLFFFFFTLLLGKLRRLFNAHPAVDVSRCSAVSLSPSAASNYRLYQSDISPRTSVGRGVEPYRTADSVVAPTSEGEEARWEGAETRRPATFLPPPPQPCTPPRSWLAALLHSEHFFALYFLCWFGPQVDADGG